MAIRLTAAVCSNVGNVRSNNEDNFCLNGLHLKANNRDKGGLFMCRTKAPAIFAVCDGMGGEADGEEASLLSAKNCMNARKKLFKNPDAETMKQFFLDGNTVVLENARSKNNRSGSTATVLVATEQGLRLGNLGDSRAYRLHGEEMTQISLDHTEMRRLLELKMITPEEVRTHPKRHMILQYWGMPTDRATCVPYVAEPIPAESGDRYLLCSDGLTDVFTDEELKKLLDTDAQPSETAEAMVQAAMDHGSRDNVTVMVIDVDDSKQEPKNERAVQRRREFRRSSTLRTLALVLGLLVAAAIPVIYLIASGR